jgi:DNA invertase Pin-like site-specific DNA recombinase
MNVVAYCRYSSEAQRDGYSIEAQLHAIREFCTRNNYNLLTSYIDEARTGTSDNREQFQEMIAAAEEHQFSAIVVHKLDRFARDRYDSAVYKKKLRDHGVRVISVTEQLDDSPESTILESVLEGMAEYYSKNLSRETKKGKRQAAREGRYTGGVLPLGIGVDKDKRYVVIEEEAVIVRQLFERINMGYSIYKTAQWAAERGLRNKTGNLINSYFVRGMIRNPIYAGTLMYGKKGKTGQGEFRIDGVVEPIVDPDMFWSIYHNAQKRNVGPVNKPRSDKDFILTGYLYCGKCGAHLKGHSKRFRKLKGSDLHEYQYDYYRCTGSIKTSRHDDPSYHDKCDLSLVRRGDIEDAVISDIEHKFMNDKNLTFMAERVHQRLQERAGRSTEEIKKIEDRLNELQNKQERLLEVYLNGTIDQNAFSAKNSELSKSIVLVSDDLRKAKVKRSSVDVATIKKAIATMNVSAASGSPEYRRQLLSTFVESVIVTNEQYQINYKVSIFNLSVVPDVAHSPSSPP